MSDPEALTKQDVNRLFDEVRGLLEREEGNDPIVSKMPDGTYWEYDDDLQATVEVRRTESDTLLNTKRVTASFASKISTSAQHSGA